MAETFTFTARKALRVIANLVINLTYFGWRPSVVYLSGKRRRVSL